MALHDERAGAVAPTLLPFSRFESRDPADLPEHVKQLGKVYDMHDGIKAKLVIAALDIPKAAISGSYALSYASAAAALADTAGLTTGAGQPIMGFTFPGMRDVLAGELHWAMLPSAGEARLSVVGNGGLTAGSYLTSAAGGLVDDAAISAAPGVTPIASLETVAGGAVAIATAQGNVAAL